MKNKIITFFLCLVMTPITSFASSNVASEKATATVAASCTISAQNLAFGNLVLPISTQSATSSMNVLCSKNAPYTIGLAYGGVYGTTQNVTEPYVYYGSYKYIQGGQALYYVCEYMATSPSGQTSTTTTATGGSCPATDNSYTFSTSYAYGKMTGVAKGDSIGYSIQVPNNSSQIWNTGNSSYSAIGTGANQTIPVVGSLVPSQTPNKFPTPDMYMDTVSAIINF